MKASEVNVSEAFWLYRPVRFRKPCKSVGIQKQPASLSCYKKHKFEYYVKSRNQKAGAKRQIIVEQHRVRKPM